MATFRDVPIGRGHRRVVFLEALAGGTGNVFVETRGPRGGVTRHVSLWDVGSERGRQNAEKYIAAERAELRAVEAAIRAASGGEG